MRVPTLLLCLALSLGAAVGQTTTPPPAPPPAAPPSPPATPPADPPRPPAPVAEMPTLAPGRTDPSGADEVVLVGKPAAIVRGQAKWDDNFATLQGVFARIRAQMAAAGAKAGGMPLVIFLESDDTEFKYEAMVPLAPDTSPTIAFQDGVTLGMTPSGKAIRFAHKAPYDDIDSTYEIITAYLDAKGIEVKDAFIEEYLGERQDSADPNFELHIYVQPK